LSSLAGFVDFVSFGQHTLVQDAGDQNTSTVLAVKHNVLTTLHSAEARANIVRRPSQLGFIGKPLATFLKIVEVPAGLARAPSPKTIGRDGLYVGFSPARETQTGHRPT
jgi:hypothetical protein